MGMIKPLRRVEDRSPPSMTFAIGLFFNFGGGAGRGLDAPVTRKMTANYKMRANIYIYMYILTNWQFLVMFS